MRYGIIGMGPVGAVFAGLLGARGHAVSVLDNNPHRGERFQSKPLKITGHYQSETQLSPVFTTFSEFAASDPDVVLIAVKTHALKDILDRIQHFPDLCTKAIISCQNGIDTELEIARVVGEDHVFRMILNFGVSYSATNEVSVNFLNEPHFLSNVNSKQTSFAKKLVDELNEAGLTVEYVEDIKKESFKKAILNATLSSICTLTRMTMSEVMDDPELLKMVKEMLRESIGICKELDVDLGENFFEEAMAYLYKGGHHKPSMLVDIEKERQTEIGHLAGKLFEYAEKKDLSVPLTQSMYYLVKSLEASVMLRKYIQHSYE